MCIYIYRLNFFPRDSVLDFHHDQAKGWNQWVRINITVYRVKMFLPILTVWKEMYL